MDNPSNPRQSRAVFLAAGVLILSGIAAYSNSLRCPFVFDDITSIVENPTIRNLSSSWWVALTPVTSGFAVGGRPILNLSLALNYALGGENVVGYHVFNLFIHLTAGLFLLGIARRTLEKFPHRPAPEPTNPAGVGRLPASTIPATGWALAISLLWLLHPLHTAAVTFIVQRSESLMGMLFLATLYCFIRATETAQTAANPPASPRSFPLRRGWACASVFFCCVGMWTKEVTATAPLLVLCYDRAFLTGSLPRAWRARWKYHATMAGSLLLIIGQLIGTGGTRGGVFGTDDGITWGSYLLTQFEAIIHYLRLAFWPHPLIFEYGVKWVQNPGEVIPYAIALGLIVLGAWIAWWRNSPLGFFGACFFAILSPTSLLPNKTQMIAEHRMYLPLAAVICAVAWSLRHLRQSALHANPAGSPPSVPFLGGRRFELMLFGMICVTATALGVATFERNREYRSALALWSATVENRPNNALAHAYLGLALYHEGDLTGAIHAYEQSAKLDPKDPMLFNALGLALRQTRDDKGAQAAFERALLLQPAYPDAHINYGSLLLAEGRLPEAADHFNTAIRIRRDRPQAYFGLGETLLRSNDAAAAVPAFEAALELAPDFPETRNRLAAALLRVGRFEAALEQYAAALKQTPDKPELHFNLATALAQGGRPKEALAHYQKAVELRPDYADAFVNYGNTFALLEDWSSAAEVYRKALHLQPESNALRLNLAHALFQLGRQKEALDLVEQAISADPNDQAARGLWRMIQEKPKKQQP